MPNMRDVKRARDGFDAKSHSYVFFAIVIFILALFLVVGDGDV
jgi:hypothetical protein